MIRARHLRKDAWYAKSQLALFMLCVSLSLICVVAIGGLSNSAQERISQDAKELVGADITVSSSRPFSPELQQSLDEVTSQVESARVFEFLSIVSSKESITSLSSIKAVDPAYPFYGEYRLLSGKSSHDQLTTGTVLVDDSIINRLNVSVGDTLSIGESEFIIADVIVEQPGIDLEIFTTSTLLMHAEDLAQTGLLGARSRVDFEVLFRVQDPQLRDSLAATLKEAAQDRERVRTVLEQESRVSRYVDNTLVFLRVIALFVMVLAGFGISLSLQAYIRRSRQTIAVRKVMGMSPKAVTTHYALIVGMVAGIGVLIGIVGGILVQYAVPVLFSDFIPDIEQTISWKVIGEGVAIGIAVTIAFALLPLQLLVRIKPLDIIRLTPLTSRSPILFLFSSVVVGAIVITELGLSLFAAYFILAFGVFYAALYGLSRVTMKILGWCSSKTLVIRQAFRSLRRPGNASVMIITSLAASLTVICSIVLINENLNANLQAPLQDGAPSVFFIDIQPDQIQPFNELFEEDLIFYPIIRGSITSIKGQPLDIEQERERGGEPIWREFSLTYSNEISSSEEFITGTSLFDSSSTDVQVSIMDEMSSRLNVDVGDTLTFSIQGLEVQAVISSVRTRTVNDIRPYFYFTFQPETLQNAPQTVFTTLSVEPDEVGSVESKVASNFPTVTTIDVTQITKKTAEILSQLSLLIQFFSLFSIAAGVLILITSIIATSLERLQETVFYRLLGANSRFVLSVNFIEYICLGIVALLIAVFLAEIGAYLLFTYAFELTYAVLLSALLPYIVGTLVLLPITGILVSLPTLRKKPIEYLRENSE